MVFTDLLWMLLMLCCPWNAFLVTIDVLLVWLLSRCMHESCLCPILTWLALPRWHLFCNDTISSYICILCWTLLGIILFGQSKFSWLLNVQQYTLPHLFMTFLCCVHILFLLTLHFSVPDLYDLLILVLVCPSILKCFVYW